MKKKTPDFHDVISKNQPGFQPQKTAQSLINQGSPLFFSHNSLAASIVYSRQSQRGCRHMNQKKAVLREQAPAGLLSLASHCTCASQLFQLANQFVTLYKFV
jgi:hypothetical protein